MGFQELHRQATIFIMLFYMTTVWAGAVRLTWHPNTEPDLAGYRVYYGPQRGKYAHFMSVTAAPSVVIPNLTDNIEYSVAVTALDTADNESRYSKEIIFILGDTTAPAIVAVSLLDESHLQLQFDESLAGPPVQNVINYTLNNGVEVLSAKLDENNKTVLLTTSAHSVAGEYSITVQNLTDVALPANTMAPVSMTYTYPPETQDNTPPLISSAHLVSEIELEVVFSEPVDPGTAQDPQNYRIDHEVDVTHAKLRRDNTVRLKTTPHVANTSYTVTINNIVDLSPRQNRIPDNSTYSYHFSPGDAVGPVVTLVNVIDVDHVELLFNEPVDKSSAENITHYNINGDIRVLAAQLDNTGRIVRLHTTAHSPNFLYLLRVSQITDASPAKNAVHQNGGYAYVFEPDDSVPPLVRRVDVLDETHVRVIFSESVDPETAQNISNYELNGSVSIVNAVMDASGSGVYLQTTPHSAGRIYVLRVFNIKDDSPVGNTIAPNTAYTYVIPGGFSDGGPVIVQVRPDVSSLYVHFDRPLFPETATNILNYRTSPELSIHNASLGTDGKTVLLETGPHEIDILYNLTVSDIRDTLGNPCTTGGPFTYIYRGKDTLKPFITLVQTVDRENIAVLFSEKLDRVSAENIHNYTITGGVQVLDARLDGSGRVVHLHTTLHGPDQLYVLNVQHIRDAGAAANEILANSQYSYLFHSTDKLGPMIALVRPVNSNSIEVSFNEPVDFLAALDPRNYTLSHQVQVLTAKKGRADFIVELSTTPLPEDKILILQVNNVKDPAGNAMYGNNSYTFSYENSVLQELPSVVDIKNLNATELLLVFEKPVSGDWLGKISSYAIYGGVTITGAETDESGTVVKLTTSPHQRDKLYVLTINGTKNSGPYFYYYSPLSTVRPLVKSVVVVTDNLLKITFTSALDRASAENLHNYAINRDMAVLAAQLDASGTAVYLETSRHRAGVAYSLNISEVMGVDEGRVNTFTAYTFLPSLQLHIDGAAETSLSYLDVGKPYYLDRNYVVTRIPDFMHHARLVMTLNGEKDRTDPDYMTLQLSQAAFVYVGFDSRADAVPRWLSSRFTKTNESIGVTDDCEHLELWRCYCAAGKVELGGNNASGAKNTESMYVVVILEPSDDVPDYGKFDAAYNSQGRFPTQFELFQNFPNPFNPRTTIRFDLPEGRSCKITVFDMLGRRVAVLYDGYAPAGEQYVEWNGLDERGNRVSSGVYFYRLEIWRNGQYNGLPYRQNYQSIVKKMMLIK